MAKVTTSCQVIELPFETVKKSNGFAVDIGGSVAKIVYIDNEDWDFTKDEPKRVGSGLACVRIANFQRDQSADIVQFIQDHCHITRHEGQETIVHSTGFGGNEFGREIAQPLNIKLKNLTEFDLFDKSFRYIIEHLPKEKTLHKTPQSVEEKMAKMFAKFKEISTKAQEFSKGAFGDVLKKMEETTGGTKDSSEPKGSNPKKEDTLFPCMLGVLGSGVLFLKLDEGGRFRFVDGSERGGKLFLGIGSLLTGAKTFDELIALAEKGDDGKVNQYCRDMRTGGPEDAYSHMPPDMLIFGFGKAVGKDLGDFKREDIARAILQLICNDMAQLAYMTVKDADVKTLYMSGSFSNSLLVREIITQRFFEKLVSRGEWGKRQIHFVKNGGHLGALGAFLEGCV